MSVWYAIPSKRSQEEAEPCLTAWRERGYKIALWLDEPRAGLDDIHYVRFGAYPGYAQAVNALVKHILAEDEYAEWIVTGGDDVFPDPNHTAQEIAEKCNWHFGSRLSAVISGDCDPRGYFPSSHTFGVMQPTGDGHGIETIAGSPWMGREFCERINGGNGPLWPEYTHAFVDNELQEVAKMLGIFWQRRDLTHRHDNWMWTTGVRPAFLDQAYSPEHWNKYLPLFFARRAAGFPGHQPLISVNA